MTIVQCPFCGKEHDSEVKDLTAHYAGYLELDVEPKNIKQLPALVYAEMKTRDLPITHKILEDGWTE